LGKLCDNIEAPLHDRAMLDGYAREVKKENSELINAANYLGLKEWPQPQVSTALGLLTMNPSPITDST
jgi:hypothetical protein